MMLVRGAIIGTPIGWFLAKYLTIVHELGHYHMVEWLNGTVTSFTNTKVTWWAMGPRRDDLAWIAGSAGQVVVGFVAVLLAQMFYRFTEQREAGNMLRFIAFGYLISSALIPYLNVSTDFAKLNNPLIAEQYAWMCVSFVLIAGLWLLVPPASRETPS
jgi:uncharacterized membrane protein YwzB